ncbi:hypothetical protein MD588_25450 [Photobacterium sp. SDRW27]|uniref:hypothetical protein n=1 Tax=Photobacterium obscurum TaxID=2829490 RepID=UPI002242FD60|nr:hypothetical protein [Photobacterium obscurum]MCW8332140.1 hypothetical protein [Photobacterium obscurum]
MKNRKVSNEVQFLVVSVICAAVLVFGHLILTKSLSDQVWVEYTAAAIPFVLLVVGVFSIRFAIASERQK